jgi:CRP-like cAMP-binding protein
MATAITDVQFEAGETIYRRGEIADAQWWITSGEVDLVSHEGEPPWTFRAGGVIGVLDVLLGRTRARTAIARTDVEAMELASEDWFEVMEDHPEYLAQVRREVTRDMHDNIHAALVPDGGFPPPEPDDGRAAWLEPTAVERLVALRSVMYFERANVQALVELGRHARVRHVAAGDVLFDRGESGDRLFVVAAGLVRAESELLVGRFGRGRIVGDAVAFSPAMARFRAEAEAPSILLELRTGDLDDVCEDHFELSRSIWRGSAMDRDRLMTLKARRIAAAEASTPPPAAGGEDADAAE